MTPGEFDETLQTAIAIVKDEEKAAKDAARASKTRR